ncbi:MAG: hypothetical protein ACTSWY_09080 [Promethearchaeota archaeon]
MEHSNDIKKEETFDDNSEKNKPIDHELERIRLKRMKKLIDQKKVQELQQNRAYNDKQKVETVLRIILTPAAYNYLNNIKNRDEDLFIKIKQTFLPPQILSQIDTLLIYMRKGMLRRGVITQTDIQQMERQILGIGSKITIKKRNHESTELSSFLKKA